MLIIAILIYLLNCFQNKFRLLQSKKRMKVQTLRRIKLPTDREKIRCFEWNWNSWFLEKKVMTDKKYIYIFKI